MLRNIYWVIDWPEMETAIWMLWVTTVELNSIL